MIYEGGSYVLAFSLLFLAVYALVLCLQQQSWRPLTALTAVNLWAAGFSAPKLLPALALLGGHPRVVGAGEATFWGDLIGTFIDRYDDFGMVNTGCYLGIVVVVLYLVSLFRLKGQLPLVAASLALLSVAMGNFAHWAPWTLLHALPLFGSFHTPMRVLIVFSFSVSLLVGLLLGGGESGRQPRWGSVAVALLVAGIALDLSLLGRGILAQTAQPVQPFIFRVNGPTHLDKPAELYHVAAGESAALGRRVPALHRPFCQVRVPDLSRFAHGGWSDQYPRLLRNRGVVDAYETFPFERRALAVTDPGYRGEYYLAGAAGGEVLLREWSPNKVRYQVRLERGNILVVNQNYGSGWRASRGVVREWNGLLVVELGPGAYDVELRYLPRPFLAGVALCLATLAAALCSSRLGLFGRAKAVAAAAADGTGSAAE